MTTSWRIKDNGTSANSAYVYNVTASNKGRRKRFRVVIAGNPPVVQIPWCLAEAVPHGWKIEEVLREAIDQPTGFIVSTTETL